MHLANEDTIFTFNTNVLINGYSFAKVEHFKLLTDSWKNPEDFPYNQEVVEQVSTLGMQEIRGKVIPIHCRRLEELEEGTELTVCGIKEITEIKFDSLYISNYWLEKQMICAFV